MYTLCLSKVNIDVCNNGFYSNNKYFICIYTFGIHILYDLVYYTYLQIVKCIASELLCTDNKYYS